MFFASTLNLIDSGFDIASATRTSIQSRPTYDNLTAIAFPAAAAGGRIVRRAWDLTIAVIWFVGCLGYYLGQSFGEEHYKVRAAAMAIEVEELAVVRMMSGADFAHHAYGATHRYLVELVKGRDASKVLDCGVVGGGFAELQSVVRVACPGWRMTNWELVREVSI